MTRLSRKVEQSLQRRKKRQRQGRPVASNLVKVPATQAERDQFTRLHGKMLLWIEHSIAEYCLKMSVDDTAVAAAIESMVQSVPSGDHAVVSLVRYLEQVRVERECPEDIWRTGLRVIYRSLRTVSKCRTGEITYLLHAARFLSKRSCD